MTWKMARADEADIDELMTWFQDGQATNLWSGPKFRFPFTRRKFRNDCRWTYFANFGLRDVEGQLIAFGQIGRRYRRCHFARLVVSPAMRGVGAGKALVNGLLAQAATIADCKECGLFVYRHNLPALRCYQSAGFVIQEYPAGARLPDECYYLTRPLP